MKSVSGDFDTDAYVRRISDFRTAMSSPVSTAISPLFVRLSLLSRHRRYSLCLSCFKAMYTMRLIVWSDGSASVGRPHPGQNTLYRLARRPHGQAVLAPAHEAADHVARLEATEVDE